MKYDKITRRHFLQGAGGSFLALPFLPSLLSNAEAATLPNPKFMVSYWNAHGGVNAQNMYPIGTNPAVAGALRATTIYGAQNHVIYSGTLTSLRTTRSSNLPYLNTALDTTYRFQVDGTPLSACYSMDTAGADFDNGASRLTPIIGSFVSDAMLGKMNLLAGLDLMYYLGHGGVHLGQFCAQAGVTPASASANGMTNVWFPTIDAVAAKYPAFYGANTPVVPSLMLNAGGGGWSPYLSSFMTPTGIEANGNSPYTLGQAFTLLFGSLSGTTTPAVAAKKNFILNRVHDDYARVARGAYGPGRRIGKDDRNRLEEFMTMLSSIISGFAGGGACTPPAISPTDSRLARSEAGDPTGSAATLHLYNQLIAAAFSCGLTQQVIFGMPGLLDTFTPSGSPGQTFTDGVTGPDSHQALYHEHNYADRQPYLVKSQRFYFQNAFYDLMQVLDGMSAPAGGTMLDRSLLFWTHEAGFNTHNANCLPMIMAGSAGGFFKTGNFVDYRNANIPLGRGTGTLGHVGIPYNRFLGTVLQSLGVPPSYYELSPTLFAGSNGRIPVSSSGTVPGYGHTFQGKYDSTAGSQLYLYDYQLNDMSIPLPIIT